MVAGPLAATLNVAVVPELTPTGPLASTTDSVTALEVIDVVEVTVTV
jgi:hypothetical protein